MIAVSDTNKLTAHPDALRKEGIERRFCPGCLPSRPGIVGQRPAHDPMECIQL